MDTKALRQKILDLAIRGKLVPQDPADEPASVLLERIRAEKQQMVKDGKLKAKDIKNDTVIYVGEDNLHYEKFSDGTVKCIEDEIPFEIPDGWAWARLRSLLNLFITGPFGSSLHKSDYVSSGTPLINPMNIVNGRIQANPQMLVSQDTVSRLSVFKVLEGDIVIARRGEMGRCAVVESSQNGWLCGTGSFDLRVSRLIDSNYIAARIRASDSVTFLSGNSLGNTMLNLNQSILNSLLIPVPPFNEQRRVLCAISEADGLLSTLAESNTKLRTFIVDAKAKILDLAIRGKLVPQDPADEPASILLERIRADKEEQIKAGKIKRDKKESFIFRGEDNSYYEKIGDEVRCIDSEIPYTIPGTWTWCRGWSCFKEQESVTPPAGSFLYIDIDSIDNTRHVIARPKTLDGSDAPSRARRRIQTGSVVFSLVRPYLENIALVTDAHSGGIASTGFYVCSSEGMMIPSYMFLLMTSRYVVHGLNQFMKGDNSPSISKNDIEQWLYPIPPICEQQKISKAVDHFFELIQKIEQSLN